MKAQKDLGVKISVKDIQASESAKGNIDLKSIQERKNNQARC